MSTQPEALRLADALTQPTYPDWVVHIPAPWHPPAQKVREAAAELRRLHTENEAARLVGIQQERDLMKAKAQRDALLEALKTYGWHTEDCPQYPTHARPKNLPDCTCWFDATIAAVEGEKT